MRKTPVAINEADINISNTAMQDITNPIIAITLFDFFNTKPIRLNISVRIGNTVKPLCIPTSTAL